MSKVIKVTSCISCPYQTIEEDDHRYCSNDEVVEADWEKFISTDPSREEINNYKFDGRELIAPAPTIIPEWCPLPDAGGSE